MNAPTYAGAAMLELLRAVAEVLNASSMAAEARAIERLREAARVPLEDGLTLLEAALDAAEHAAGAHDLAVLEQYRDSKAGAPAPAANVPAVCMPVTVLATGRKSLTVVIDPDRATAIRLENDTTDARDVKVTLELEPLEREPIVHRGRAITVPNQETADAVTFTSKAGPARYFDTTLQRMMLWDGETWVFDPDSKAGAK